MAIAIARRNRTQVMVFPINLQEQTFVFAPVAYLAVDADESCSVLRVRIRLISIARFDSKGLYIGMTCGWLISSYAKLRCHVGKRSKLRRGRERGRKREKQQRCEYRFGFPDACREEKSTRLEITINLRGIPQRSRLIRFESINKKLNVTRITDYVSYDCALFVL